MKTGTYIFALVVICAFFYLGFNHFEFPTIFIFEKTEQTNGIVTKTKWTRGVKGSRLQLVTYKYKVKDSVYTDKFKAGQIEGLQNTGDEILIEYSVEKPEKNEVIGFY